MAHLANPCGAPFEKCCRTQLTPRSICINETFFLHSCFLESVKLCSIAQKLANTKVFLYFRKHSPIFNTEMVIENVTCKIFDPVFL